MRVTSYSVELDGLLNVLVKEKSVNYNKVQRISSPNDTVLMMNDVFGLNRKAEEYMYLLAMNMKNRLIGVFLVSKGTVDTTVISPRDIFVRLCLSGASRFILVHNHPSGDPTPSTFDFELTERIEETSVMMNIVLLDHIIIGNTYYSFKENWKLGV